MGKEETMEKSDYLGLKKGFLFIGFSFFVFSVGYSFIRAWIDSEWVISWPRILIVNGSIWVIFLAVLALIRPEE